MGQSLKDQSQVIHGLSKRGAGEKCMQYHFEGDEGGAFRPCNTFKGVFSVMSKTSDTYYFTLLFIHFLAC